MAEDKFGFDQVQKNIGTLKISVPRKLAAQARNYFRDAFKKQAWDGVPWKEVQRRIPGTKAYMYPKKKDMSRQVRPIELGKTGKEERAVNNSVVVRTWPTIRLVVDMTAYGAKANYAKFQNEGTPKMVARTFMGQTDELTRMQRELIRTEVDRVFKTT